MLQSITEEYSHITQQMFSVVAKKTSVYSIGAFGPNSSGDPLENCKPSRAFFLFIHTANRNAEVT